MSQGGEQILLSPGRNIDGNVPRKSNYDNIRGKVIIQICMVIILPKII